MELKQRTLTVFQKTHISEPALFSPSDTTKKVEDFPEICVSTFSENIIETFSSMENTKKIADLYTANGKIPVYKFNIKKPILPFIYPESALLPVSQDLRKSLLWALRNLFCSAPVGVLDEDRVKNNLIIPISAIRDEGTSYHYLPPSPEVEADSCSIETLEHVFQKFKCPYVKGKTWTSDAIYRETIPAIKERRQNGCIAVEMECASMLAVSKYRQIPFIQFLYGADHLNSDTWEIRDLTLYGQTNSEKYMSLAFECGLAMQIK